MDDVCSEVLVQELMTMVQKMTAGAKMAQETVKTSTRQTALLLVATGGSKGRGAYSRECRK